MGKAKKFSTPNMRTIIKQELRSRRWSMLWWVIGISAFNVINVAVYPSFRDQAEEYNKIFEQMPKALVDMFSDTGDFMSPSGYLSGQIFYMLLPLIFCVLTIGLGASLIAREERNKTIELLLSRPISRGKLLLGKALAGLSVAGIIGLGSGLLLALMIAVIGFEGITFPNVMLATFMTLLMSLLFGYVAFMLTAMGAFGRGASIAVASLVAIAGYVISSLVGTVHWLSGPAKAFPYHYFKPGRILEGQFSVRPALVFSLAIAVLIFVSWVSFRRRDLD